MGQCFGAVVRSRGIGGNFMAGLRSIVGSEIKELSIGAAIAAAAAAAALLSAGRCVADLVFGRGWISASVSPFHQ